LTKTTITIELSKELLRSTLKAAQHFITPASSPASVRRENPAMWTKDCPELETIFLSKQRGHVAG